MEVMETVYMRNTERKIDRGCIPFMIQMTPTNYWRRNTNVINNLEQMESQM